MESLVSVQLTPDTSTFHTQLRVYLQDEIHTKNISRSDLTTLQELSSAGGDDGRLAPLSVADLRLIRTVLPSFSLSTALQGGKVVVPGIKERVLDPEKEKVKQQLRDRLDNIAYDAMVKGVDVRQAVLDRVEPREEGMGSQASLGLNVGLTVIGVFFGTYSLFKNYYGDETNASIIGLCAAMFILVVETVLIIIHSNRRDRQHELKVAAAAKTTPGARVPVHPMDEENDTIITRDVKPSTSTSRGANKRKGKR